MASLNAKLSQPCRVAFAEALRLPWADLGPVDHAA
jgi:hypothetical protein